MWIKTTSLVIHKSVDLKYQTDTQHLYLSSRVILLNAIFIISHQYSGFQFLPIAYQAIHDNSSLPDLPHLPLQLSSNLLLFLISFLTTCARKEKKDFSPPLSTLPYFLLSE